jgi:hypothetical protein
LNGPVPSSGSEVPAAPIHFRPRLWSRNAADFGLVWFVVAPLVLGLVFGLPAGLAYLVTGSPPVTLGVLTGVYLLYVAFSVRGVTVSPEGIRFHRWLGNPRLLPWGEIRSIAIAPPAELIRQGWLWPLFPSREMTASLTTIGHYRITWGAGYCYYPPADAAGFEAAVRRFGQIEPG